MPTNGKWNLTSKKKVLYIANHADRIQYLMNGQRLSAVNKEMDFGIIILNHLKPSQHYSEEQLKLLINWLASSDVLSAINLKSLF